LASAPRCDDCGARTAEVQNTHAYMSLFCACANLRDDSRFIRQCISKHCTISGEKLPFVACTCCRNPKCYGSGMLVVHSVQAETWGHAGSCAMVFSIACSRACRGEGSPPGLSNLPWGPRMRAYPDNAIRDVHIKWIPRHVCFLNLFAVVLPF